MPPIIDHNPHEKRQTNTALWILVAALAFSAIMYFTSKVPDWWALGLGAAIGGTLATVAIEITGNKVPDWWRR